MELNEYFIKHGMTQRHLSKLIPCSFQYLSLISSKKRKPGKLMAQRIVDLTNGEVTLNELNKP